MKKNLLIVLLVAGGLLFIASCKKTIGLDPLPQNKILEYKVTNLPDTVITGIIDNTDNTVTVYVPYYYGMTIIDPEIKLSDGATLTDPILPVKIEDNTQTYTVKGVDGSTNTYKLNIVQQNPPTLTLAWTKTASTYPLGRVPNINGNFLTTNAALVKITIISVKTDIETALNTSASGILLDAQGGYKYDGGLIPATIDTGYYKVRVDFLQKSVELPEPLLIAYRPPSVTASARIVKQGEDFELGATVGYMILGLKAVKATINGITYNLPIKSYTYDKMTLTIPEDVPLMTSATCKYTFEYDNWPTTTSTSFLTVTPK